MPKAYARVGDYYKLSVEPHPNMLDRMELMMNENREYEDTFELLENIFPPGEFSSTEMPTDHFLKCRSEYIPP